MKFPGKMPAIFHPYFMHQFWVMSCHVSQKVVKYSAPELPRDPSRDPPQVVCELLLAVLGVSRRKGIVDLRILFEFGEQRCRNHFLRLKLLDDGHAVNVLRGVLFPPVFEGHQPLELVRVEQEFVGRAGNLRVSLHQRSAADRINACRSTQVTRCFRQL